MALFKCPGLEVEFRWGAFFAEIQWIGEVWIEMNTVLRGRRWADYMFEGGSLLLYLGRTHIVLCPARKQSVTSAA